MTRKKLVTFPSPRRQQGELFAADTRYVLLLSAIISSGKAAEIGPIALAVLVCLRTHANYQTGRCSVGQRLISKQIGASTGSVAKAIKLLEEQGLIKRTSFGGARAVYEIQDEIPLFHDEKRAGEMLVPFVPLFVRDRLDEAREAARTGEVPAKSPITLNLTINIINNSGSGSVVVHGGNTFSMDALPENIRSTFERMIRQQAEEATAKTIEAVRDR